MYTTLGLYMSLGFVLNRVSDKLGRRESSLPDPSRSIIDRSVGERVDEKQESQTMNDAMTKKLLYVSTDGTAGPYIMVPVSQLIDLRELLDKHRIGYLVEEDAISLDGEPEIAVVDLGQGADETAVQAILDSLH